MKILVCGIIAAAVSTAAWLGLEVTLHKDLAWLACVVGFVTGMSVYLTAGRNAGGSAARGALAAVLTVAAMTIGHQLVAVASRPASDQNARAQPAAKSKPAQPKNQSKTPDTDKPATPAVKTDPATKPAPETKSATGRPAKPVTTPKAKSAQPATKPTEKPAAKPEKKVDDKPITGRLAADLKRGLGSWEMVWFGLSILIAYVSGRGRGAKIPPDDVA